MKVDVFWIPENKIGKLAIMPRPRSGDWLNDEIKAWKRAGVTTIVSTLTHFEVIELELHNEEAVCREHQIEFISIPIADRQVPKSYAQINEHIQNIEGLLKMGHGVAIHCRMGVGRSAMLAGCLLARQGLVADQIFSVITKARGIEVPDTKEQKQWVIKSFTYSRFKAL